MKERRTEYSTVVADPPTENEKMLPAAILRCFKIRSGMVALSFSQCCTTMKVANRTLAVTIDKSTIIYTRCREKQMTHHARGCFIHSLQMRPMKTSPLRGNDLRDTIGPTKHVMRFEPRQERDSSFFHGRESILCIWVLGKALQNQ